MRLHTADKVDVRPSVIDTMKGRRSVTLILSVMPKSTSVIAACDCVPPLLFFRPRAS